MSRNPATGAMTAGAAQLNPASPDTPGLTSSRGRLVKPKVWDDGTEAVPAVGFRGPPKPVAKDKEKEKEKEEPVKSESSHEMAPQARTERAKWRPNYANSLAKRGSVPIRDETGRFIGVRPKTAAERLQRQTLGSGGIFKSAAVDVLRLERRLMSTGDIAKVALQRGLIKCQGKTPEATMASALYTDVKRKEGHSIFIRPHEGLFGLREWADKGLVFKVMEDDEHYVDDPKNPQFQHHGGEYAYQGGNSGEGFQGEHEGFEASDGDIYGSEGQYIRYEEGNWDEAYDEQYQDVSSGQPFANPRGRSGSARPAHSYGADRYSGDNMAGPDAAYITPETTAPLQAAGQDTPQDAISGGRPGSAARSGARSGGRTRSAAARSAGNHQADSRMSPATDEENSNIMLLLDAAEELHKTASHDGPEPSTAATNGAQKDDAAYPPSKHARLHKDHTTPKSARVAARGGPAGRGGTRATGRGKAKMLADESRFSRPHPLQAPDASKRDQFRAGSEAAARGTAGEEPPVLPHHASFPETAAELVLDLTVEGRNAGSSSTAYTGFGDRPGMAGPDQVNILNLPLPDFDSMSGTSANYPEERPDDMDPAEPDGITSAPTPHPNLHPSSAPPGSVIKGRLQSLEQNLLVLERNYGATHPQVGKAWLLLSKIYQSNPAQTSQVMAEAALVRSWEVYALCQGAAQPEDLTPATVQSFSHLLEKIQRNPDKTANVTVLNPQQQRQQLQQAQHHRLLQQQQQQLQLQQLQQLRQQQQAQLALQAQRQAQAQQMPVSSQTYAAPAQTQLHQQAQAQSQSQLQHQAHPQTQLQQQAQAQGVTSLYGTRQWPGGYAPGAAQHSQGMSPGPTASLHQQLSAQLQAQQQRQLQQQQKPQQQLGQQPQSLLQQHSSGPLSQNNGPSAQNLLQQQLAQQQHRPAAASTQRLSPQQQQPQPLASVPGPAQQPSANV